MIVAIVGSRPATLDVAQQTRARNTLTSIVKNLPPEDDIVTGDAEGVDTWVRIAAAKTRVIIQVIPAWKRDGRRAGPMRNRRIAAICDRMIAFWDGKSPGTKSAIAAAYDLKKEVHIVVIGDASEDPAACRDIDAWTRRMKAAWR